MGLEGCTAAVVLELALEYWRKTCQRLYTKICLHVLNSSAKTFVPQTCQLVQQILTDDISSDPLHCFEVTNYRHVYVPHFELS